MKIPFSVRCIEELIIGGTMNKQGKVYRTMLAVLLVFGFVFNVNAEGQKEKGADDAQTLSFITWRGDDSAGYDAIVEAFEEKYPNIDVNVEYFKGGTTYDGIVTTRGMGGELDFYAAQPGGQLAAYVQAGYAMDITDQDFIKRVSGGALAAGSYDGITYGVAQAVSTNCVFYNKEIFAEYGLSIPTTWDEFINICDTLKENGVTPLAAGLSQTYIAQNFYKMMAAHMMPEDAPSYWQAINTKDMTLQDEPFPTILNEIKRLWDNEYYIDGVEGVDKHAAAALFAQGKVAMDVEGTWRTGTIANAEGAPDFGMFSLPFTGNPNKVTHVVAPNQTHLIFPGSKKKEAALKFYDFMTTPEMAAIFAKHTGAVPTVNGTTVDSPIIQMILDLLDSTQPVLGPNLANTNNEVQQALYETFTKVAVGMDVNTVIEEMQNKIDGIER